MSFISHNYAHVLETRERVKSLEHKHGVVFTPSWLDTTICSWKNNILKINMFIELEVYISIQEFSLFGGEQSFSVYTK